MNEEALLISFLSNLSKSTLNSARKDLSEERAKLAQQAAEAEDGDDAEGYDSLRAEIENFVDLVDQVMKTAFYD